MAHLLWGKVFYADQFAGYLREEPGDRVLFVYDSHYIDKRLPPISHTLPVRSEPYITHHGLHPFFDNLVSEGWLEKAQTRLLGKRHVSRFELLLTFGFDCAGAVYVIDPTPSELSSALLDPEDPKEIAMLTNRASLSGVQPKLAVVQDNHRFRIASAHELSSHIAKFPSPGHDGLIENEYLTTLAFQALLPDDSVVTLSVDRIEGIDEPALLIKRFDRESQQRIHFEEFNALLARPSSTKYDGAYQDMARFIRDTENCDNDQLEALYRRIVAGLVLGNTDMHFKNFALFHRDNTLVLTPSYDQVAAALYQYKTVALAVGGVTHQPIANLRIRHLHVLAQEFGLSDAIFGKIVDEIKHHCPVAKEAIAKADFGSQESKASLIAFIEKRERCLFF